MAVLLKTFMGSSQMTNHGTVHMRKKQQSHRVVLRRRAKSNDSCSWKKHFEADDRLFLRQNWVATVPLEHRRTVNSEWYITICLPNVCGEIRKTNKRRRIIVHHDNASSHTTAQTSAFLTGQNTSNWWVICLTALTWHRMTCFYSRTSRKKCLVNDFHCQKMQLKRLKTMFWRYLNRSEKSAWTSGLRACKNV